MSDAAETAQSFSAARKLFRAGARDWIFPTYVLPKNKRRAIDAIGAFCVMIVEAIDLPPHTLAGARAMREHPVVRTAITLSQLPAQNSGSTGDACEGDTLDTRLAMLRERLDEIYDGHLELPALEGRSLQQHALKALSIAAKEFPIDRELFNDFARACRDDLTQTEYRDWKALQEYLARCAGSIGKMVASVLGVTHSQGHQRAIALASAMRCAGILRDIKDDAKRGKIYLPQEDLRKFGYSPTELQSGEVNNRWIALMKVQIARVRELYREGAEGICWLADDGSRLAVATATTTRASILQMIEENDFDVFNRKIKPNGAKKFLRLPTALKLARRMDGQPLPKF